MKRTRLFYTLAILAVVIFCHTNIKAQAVGETAPNFSLLASDGTTFTLSEQQGKVVFINFVGYSCGICINAAPTINADVFEEFGTHENFVAVAIDVWDGNEDEVNYYIENSGVVFPVLAMGSQVANDYNSGKHRVVVIDEEGIVRHNTNKDANSAEVAQAVSVVNELLGVVASASSVEQKSFQIYPNPAKSILQIGSSLAWDTKVSLNIVNVEGRVILTRKVTPETRINLNGLDRGVYFVQISNGEIFETKKLLLN